MGKFGKALVLIGISGVITGFIVWLFEDKLWFIGRLPGDIHYVTGNTQVFIPITTMILVSVLLYFILWLVREFI